MLDGVRWYCFRVSEFTIKDWARVFFALPRSVYKSDGLCRYMLYRIFGSGLFHRITMKVL